MDKSARTCSQLPVGVADAKLSRLAGLLDSLEADGLVHLAAYAPEGDWRVAGGNRFALGLQKVAVDQAGMGAEVPVDVYATKEGGPAGDEPSDNSETALVLPVRGLNIPFADVPLHEGDSVVVERFEPQYVTVLGLVGSPGNYPYPPEAQYNLAETVAFAGGLDMIAKPRYVSMYRLRADGTVASATFELVDPDNQEELTSSLATRVKPGDIVSVESTPRTRTNVFFDRYFRFSTGMYLSPPEEIWDSVGLVDSP